MIAQNCLIPKGPPKLEIVNVPPCRIVAVKKHLVKNEGKMKLKNKNHNLQITETRNFQLFILPESRNHWHQDNFRDAFVLNNNESNKLSFGIFSCHRSTLKSPGTNM